MMVEYPTEFPFDAASILISAIRSGVVEYPKAVQAGYTMVGYALGKTFAVPRVMDFHTEPPVTDNEALANRLETISNAYAGSSTPAVIAVDWQSVLVTLLPLILKWLTKS